MPIDDAGALEALLVRMRSLHDDLAERHAGICVLHLDAAIAALESHLRRNGMAADNEDQPQLDVSATR